MRKTVFAGVGALALALGTTAPALADGEDQAPEYGVTTTSIELEDCGSATITWTNPTEWTFYGDWRKGTDTGGGEATEGLDPDTTISEGPLEGKKFGRVYHLVELAPGSTETKTVEIDAGEGSVPLRAWVKRGPEQRSFSAAEPVEIPRCAPQQDDTTPPDNDGDDTPPTDGNDTTPPAEEPGEDTETGGDETATDNGGDAEDGDDTPDDGGADEADEDGTAPTPEPQDAHIAVTG